MLLNCMYHMHAHINRMKKPMTTFPELLAVPKVSVTLTPKTRVCANCLAVA